MEDLKKYLIDRLELCEGYLRSICLDKSTEFCRLLSTKMEDLPTLINDKGPVGSWASEKLKDEENWERPACFIEFLCDVEMSYDDARDLGSNDGELKCLAGVFRKLGMNTEADRAYASVYD